MPPKGTQHSEETRQKMREAAKRRSTPEYRRKVADSVSRSWLNPERRQRIAETHTGRTLTEETKRKISIAKTGQTPSAETREKLSNALRRRWQDTDLRRERSENEEWRRKLGEAHKTHGMSSHPLFIVWSHMISRCYNPNNKSYSDYGGRGIVVCDEWRCDPKPFIEYMEANLGPRPSADHSIDRIDNNGNYEPGNLRWATRSQQNRNRRRRAA